MEYAFRERPECLNSQYPFEPDRRDLILRLIADEPATRPVNCLSRALDFSAVSVSFFIHTVFRIRKSAY